MMRAALLVFAASLGVWAADVEAGKQLFAASCSVGYCHGAEGRAGRGPRLRDREWDRGYLYKVIDEGIPKSSMPAWHGKLSDDQIQSVVAYILSISKEVTRAPAEVTHAAGPTVQMGERTKAGQALFFDAANDWNCGVCHKVNGTGGDIGPDLGKMSGRPPKEILKAILAPAPSGRYAPVEIVTKEGETVPGILNEETPARLRVYDLTPPGPPVLRSFDPAAVKVRRLQTALVHGKFQEIYSREQLRDLVIFLKAPGGDAKVEMRDLFQ